MSNLYARMRQIEGTTEEWAANNLVLGDGEIAVERAAEGIKLKVGDGVKTFSEAPYIILDPSVADYMLFRGGISAAATAPATPTEGDVYNITVAGVLGASWGGLDGVDVGVGSLVIYSGGDWTAVVNDDTGGGGSSGAMLYKGGISAAATAPVSPLEGDTYSITTAGTFGGSWGALSGIAAGIGSIVIYSSSAWSAILNDDTGGGGGGSSGAMLFQGEISASSTAPVSPLDGDTYSINASGTLGASWGALSGVTLGVGSLVTYSGGWLAVPNDDASADAMTYQGQLAPSATAPVAPQEGDTYLFNATGSLGASWGALSGTGVNNGTLIIYHLVGWEIVYNGTSGGADGKSVLNGTSDPTSGVGTDGDFYINTTSDAIFGPKTGGAWGSGTSLIGPAGATGAPGANGYSVLNGTIDPTGGIGVNGDFYINTTSDAIFGPKTAGSWGSGTSLIGPTGATGATGAPGANGSSVLNGASDPTGGTGANGDFYINTTSDTIFGPKTAGAWGSGTPLVGPAGAAGSNGTNGYSVLNGASDPTGGVGVNGDFYINTSTYDIFGPKTAGAWGSGTSLIGPPGGGSSGAMLYLGEVTAASTAPSSPDAGDTYSFSTNGTLGASWTGEVGTIVAAGSIITYTGSAWTMVLLLSLPTTPGAISDLEATVLGTDSVRVTFTPNGDITGYQYRIDGGTASALAFNGEISGLSAGTEYDFQVRGINQGIVGPWSNTATVTTEGAVGPGDITDLTAVVVTTTSVQLAFTNSSGATSHQYRVNGGAATTLATDKIVTGLTPYTANTFEVRGVNGSGSGDWSNEAVEWTSIDPLAAVSGETQVRRYTTYSGRNQIDVDRRRMSACNHQEYQPKGGGRDPLHQEYLRAYSTIIDASAAPYNIVGNSNASGSTGTDWSSALASALAACPNNGAVLLPLGYIKYVGYKPVNAGTNRAVVGRGPGKTILVKTGLYDQTTTTTAQNTGSTIMFNANSIRPMIRDLAITAPAENARRNSHSFARGFAFQENATGSLAYNVRVYNVANAGTLNYRTQDTSILFCFFQNTWADSCHFSGITTARGRAQYNNAEDCGDDSYASIGSTGTPGQENTDMDFHDNMSDGGWWASGASFEGTTNGRAYRNIIRRTGAAGLRVATPDSYAGPEVNNIDCRFNILDECHQRNIGHGAMFIAGAYADISNVTFHGNLARQTPYGYGFRAQGDPDALVTGTFTSNSFIQVGGVTEPNAIDVSDADVTISVSGNTYNGALTS